jgi:hypothetical protein
MFSNKEERKITLEDNDFIVAERSGQPLTFTKKAKFRVNQLQFAFISDLIILSYSASGIEPHKLFLYKDLNI